MIADDTPTDPYADRYWVHYSVYGADLDVDSLLAEAQPSCGFEIWRTGDAEGRGRPALTSGVWINVIETGERQELIQEVGAFLDEEAAFLRAASARTGEKIWSVLGCRMWVYAKVPSGLWLQQPIVRRLAELGVDWEVNAYPCEDLDGP